MTGRSDQQGRNAPAIALLAVFLATLGSILALQLVPGTRGHQPVGSPRLSARSSRQGLLPRCRAALVGVREWGEAFSESLATGRYLRPRVQSVLTGWLRAGAGQVVAGPDRWLHFRPDVDHVTGASFLDPVRLSTRRRSAEIAPDPRPAIVQFRDQLAARGIALIVVPMPVKAGIQPESLSPLLAGLAVAVENPSLAVFKADLERAGVTVFDPTAVLLGVAREHARTAFLRGDTHWSPEGVEVVAKALAAVLENGGALPPLADPGLRSEEIEVAAPCDLAAMLGLDRPGSPLCSGQVTVRQVIGPHDQLWRPTASADVLLLADSFANTYSLKAMGEAESAGLVERLSLHLRRPVDLLVRNGDASFATREQLSTELARGRDRLAGKRVVIWEFAARELSAGNWKQIPMELGHPTPAVFLALTSGQTMVVNGTIAGMAPAPRPRSAPYADYIIGLRLTDLDGDAVEAVGKDAYVFLWAMRNYELLPAAHLRVGQRIAVRLKRWADVAREVEFASRGELYGDAAMQAEPCWGEEIEQ